MIRAILSRACLTAAGAPFGRRLPPLKPSTNWSRSTSPPAAAIDKLKAIQTLKITRTVGTGIGNNVKVVIYKKRPQLYRGEQGPAHGRRAARPARRQRERRVGHRAGQDRRRGRSRPRQKPATSTRDFDGLLVDWKEKGHTVTFEGREKLPGGEAFKLKVKSEERRRAHRLPGCVHVSRAPADRRCSTLLNGRKVERRDRLSNWRDVNGVKFPFDITEDRTGDSRRSRSSSTRRRSKRTCRWTTRCLRRRRADGQHRRAVLRRDIADAPSDRCPRRSVRQFDTEMRIAGSPFHIVPPHQQVRSR